MAISASYLNRLLNLRKIYTRFPLSIDGARRYDLSRHPETRRFRKPKWAVDLTKRQRSPVLRGISYFFMPLTAVIASAAAAKVRARTSWKRDRAMGSGTSGRVPSPRMTSDDQKNGCPYFG